MAVFLDANAHVNLNSSAIKKINELVNSPISHGHAMSHSYTGRAASSAIEEARTKIAFLIGAKSPSQIIFTSGCTQACEWAISLIKEKNFNKIYISTLEHSSVKLPFTEKLKGIELSSSKDGVANCGFRISSENPFMVCMHVQNEIGTIQPIETIKCPFLSDMSQSLGKININVSSIPLLKIALFGAHKFGGPTGIGFMYIQDSDWWQEFGTGSRYYFDRTGTPDTIGIAATAVALEESIRTLPERYERMIRFRTVFESEMEDIGLTIIGKNSARVPNTSFVRVGNKMGPYIMSQLESDGIYIGLGSACGAMNMGPNPLMAQLGYGGHSHDYIRVSQFGDYSEKEALATAKIIKRFSGALKP